MSGVDELVISLAAKGLTTGEIAAHLQDVYGAEVSKDTISRITEAVVKELAAWQSRPLPQRAGRNEMLVPDDQKSRPDPGRGRARWINRWKPALNAFAVTFEGRIEINDQQNRQQDLHRRSDRPSEGRSSGGIHEELEDGGCGNLRASGRSSESRHCEALRNRSLGGDGLRRGMVLTLLGSVIALAVAATAFAFAPLLTSTGHRAGAAALPAGFRDTVVLHGLTRPTAIAFAKDGRIFVAEQRGTIEVFGSLHDRTPKLFANLAPDVNSVWERGLLGLALAPNFPKSPYVYVLYTRDALPGGSSPRWNRQCPTPPGLLVDGCVVSGRLARLRAAGNTAVGKPKVLLTDWCQQFPSHSVGTIRFGPDGALYASAGEGAAFLKPDWGQYGKSAPTSPTPRNPCGDPTLRGGGIQQPPGAEGGSLRAQSVRRPAGQPVSLDGTIIRVDPATGRPLSTNPLAHARTPNARRIVAYGLRNPYRFTFRPGTNEIWVGDVGEFLYEEIDRVPDPQKGPVPNFGWPCYEGPLSHPKFAKLRQCETLPPAKTVYPYFAYSHWQQAVPHDGCSVKPGGSITGLAFYTGSEYPARFRNGLFFGDYTRGCIWFMPASRGGLPDPKRVQIFTTAARAPVDLETGPGGDLFYTDIKDGTVHRITYVGSAK